MDSTFVRIDSIYSICSCEGRFWWLKIIKVSFHSSWPEIISSVNSEFSKILVIDVGCMSQFRIRMNQNLCSELLRFIADSYSISVSNSYKLRVDPILRILIPNTSITIIHSLKYQYEYTEHTWHDAKVSWWTHILYHIPTRSKRKSDPRECPMSSQSILSNHWTWENTHNGIKKALSMQWMH